MTTPLKALIQERLRAKIVRQGDDDGACPGDALTSTFPTSLASTTPLIDACEYMVPAPFTDDRSSELMASGNYETNHEEKSYLHEDDVTHYTTEAKYDHRGPSPHLESNRFHQYTEYSARPIRKPSAAARQVSPLKVKHGKRAWRAGHEESSLTRERKHNNQDEEISMYSAKRARVVEMPRYRYRSEDECDVLSPTRRKNYDLSSAYQRYREISSKRERSLQSEAPVASWPELSRRDYSRNIDCFEDNYDASNKSGKHSAEWTSPERACASVKRRIEDSYDPKEDSVPLRVRHHRRLGDVHPVNHVAPAHPTVVSPRSMSTARQNSSPLMSRPHSNQFEYPGSLDRHSDRLVFPAALYVPSVSRPPSAHLHRFPGYSEDSTPQYLGRSVSHSRVLSPESRQAAKDFVEKRQKRASQGTPRTMATHRWLQSMMDAKGGDRSSTLSKALPRSEETTTLSYHPGTQSSSSNSNRFHGESTYTIAAVDDGLMGLPVNHLRDSLARAPAFYSPPVHRSGDIFEANI